jgi:hypothetical protein
MTIAFVIPYFGKWPNWFNALLISCKNNPTVDWLFFTDCPIPEGGPANVRFIKSSLGAIKVLAMETTGAQISLEHAYKLCDLKPAYGDIFKQYLKDYDFWGFCDSDIIWGDIRKFITGKLLSQYDIITALPNKIAGHFTVLRNVSKTRLLYQHENIYKTLYIQREYQWFDENDFTKIVGNLKEEKRISVCWEKVVIENGIESAAHQDYFIDRWLYENGKVFELGMEGEKRKEYLYLHFISWKATMAPNQFSFRDKVDRFFISFNRMSIQPAGRLAKWINIIRRNIWGYYRYERYMLWRKKMTRRVKKKASGYFSPSV